MKIKFKEVRPARSKSYLKHKLISATAMLLISAIMMVSTSYAWYVLSTAPEVSNIKTQVGANGALEIALLNSESWADLDLLDMGDIDESVTAENPIPATVANLTWGNLINLDDASYGLDKIILNPSRLFIMQDGGVYKVNSVPLKTPIYGEDGRVKGLALDKAVAYTFANNTFSNPDGYGVRAIGTSATMSVFQLGMNSARSTLVTYSSNARTAASNALQNTGGALANVVVAYAVSNQTSGYKNADVAKVTELANGLDSALTEIETALRQVFAGYLTTTVAAEKDGITAENYQTLLAGVNNPETSLSALLTEYADIATVVPGIDDCITKLSANQTQMEEALAKCAALTDDDHTWSEISGVIMPLMNTNSMQVNGKTIEQLKTDLRNEDGSINEQAAMDLVSGGITIKVPSGSGIISDIADFADDYTATVSVYPVMEVGGFKLDGSIGMDVQMTTDGVKPTHLTSCSNGLKAATIADAQGSNSITDYYGYAIDLAFRTNANDSNLMLQTEPENRIYDGDTRNAALQGGGSYMSFTTSTGLSATKVVKLMRGIRVVLMDGSQKILGIAALDTTLGQDIYKQELDKDNNPTGYYYLDGSAGAYQNSDLITAADYALLPPESAVEFNKTTGKITAKLYMYNYSMTVSPTSTAEETKYTGGLTIGSKATDGTITAMIPDVVQKVTALVYLDGSFVNNSTVAANAMYSMTGTLNLQFSSSAELLPATNTQLQTSGSEVIYTELDTALYEAGYLAYGDSGLYKIKDGYHIYIGSDENLYFATAESEYTKLEAGNVSTVLEQVTINLSPVDGATIAAGGKTTLTATVTGTDLTPSFVKTGDDTVATEAASGSTLTVTGVGAGEVRYYAEVFLEIGGDKYGVASNTVTITVT